MAALCCNNHLDVCESRKGITPVDRHWLNCTIAFPNNQNNIIFHVPFILLLLIREKMKQSPTVEAAFRWWGLGGHQTRELWRLLTLRHLIIRRSPVTNLACNKHFIIPKSANNEPPMQVLFILLQPRTLIPVTRNDKRGLGRETSNSRVLGRYGTVCET